MGFWPDGSRVLGNPPGLSLEAAKWLTAQGISAIAADQECVEVGPSQHEDNWLPGHCHFLAEAGVPMIELVMARPDEVFGTRSVINEYRHAA